MSHDPVILAQEAPHCYIVCCTHGTIHLNWFDVTLHLQPAQFADAVSFFDALETRLVTDAYYVTEHHAVGRCSDGRYVVWLHGLGLCLTPTELARMFRLVRTASMRLCLSGESPHFAACSGTYNSITHIDVDDTSLVFVNWRQITLTLAPARFLAAAAELCGVNAMLCEQRSASFGLCSVRMDEKEFCQLWLRGVGLYISRACFDRFVTLWETGVVAMEEQVQSALCGESGATSAIAPFPARLSTPLFPN